MRFENLMDKYCGANIAVLGSGPSLNGYKENINDCDVVIACNGSLKAMDPDQHRVDYFIYGDRKAPDDIWFSDSLKFSGIEGQCKRLSPIFMLHKDPHILKDESARERLKREYDVFLTNQNNPNNSEVNFRPSFVSDEDLNGCFYFSVNFNSNFITKGLGSLCRGATITGTAAILAYKMGAARLELYGCGFDNNGDGKNYAYIAPKGDIGKTNSKQRNKMNKILRVLGSNGVEVVSRGNTTLSNLEKII